METIVWVLHVIAAASVIGLVLLQHGKGADMGAGFGSGASGSLFGVSGSANLLSRATAVAVTVFFITSMSLAYLASHSGRHASVVHAIDTKLPDAGKKPVKPVDPSRSQEVPQ